MLSRIFLLVSLGIPWMLYIGAIAQKLAEPQIKNLRGEEFFIVGLVLWLYTTVICYGFFYKSHRKK